MTELLLRKHSKLLGHIVCLGAAFIIAAPLWLVYKISPDLFVFVIVWVIVRPIYKLHKYIDEELNL